jgi:glyoxylate carboligase
MAESDVQMAEIEFDIETYEPLPVYKPAASRPQAQRAIEMLNAAERPLIVAGGGIEELAVGAQYKLPYLHVVVDNSYLGLIRQAQRGFQMDFEVSLAFDNINARAEDGAVPGYGVDHVAVAEGLGCKAIRVKTVGEFKAAFAQADALMDEYRVPVVLEFILERVTNISMGAEVDSVNEFEEILCLDPSLSIRKSQDMDVVQAPGKREEVLAKR